jgi:hypothetical protein|tara:strand:+ start:43 stop:441 length:399 start_codon:yes stop_codon:yes gene_type:complete
MNVKIGKNQAWDYVKNDWRIKEMNVIYNIGDDGIPMAFELTNILHKTIENYWKTKERCQSVPELLVEEQCFLNISREYADDKQLCRKIIPLMFGSEKTKRKMKRKVLVEREIGKREWLVMKKEWKENSDGRV